MTQQADFQRMTEMFCKQRVRIEYANWRGAVAHAREWGGRVAVRPDGSATWYSCQYTMTPIMQDAKGACFVGMSGDVEEWAGRMDSDPRVIALAEQWGIAPQPPTE